jgi:aerobic-type carbon monoxide dehydrogenase small subunit (CoxS/CutS family)
MTDSDADISITVNGMARRLRAVPDDLALIDLLHDELGLTGTKFGCGIGICRACTVAVRPAPGLPLEAVRACTTMAVALDGREITTVEGLAPVDEAKGDATPDGRALAPLQQAFLDAFAFQCGYCTPGFLMAAFVLLDRLARTPVPAVKLDAEIAQACGDHVCRCTGYRRYHEAIRAAVMAQPGLATD